MSHYLVAVMTTEKPSEKDLNCIMRPFDENYCYMTKIDHIADFDEIEKEWNREREKYSDFESFLLKEYGYDYCDQEERVVGNWFNPHAKWDWWEVDGRWGGMIGNNGDKLRKVSFDTSTSDKKFRPYAFIDVNGHWHEPARMGWFGVSNATEEGTTKYDKEWDEVLANHGGDWYCTVIDCHI